MNFLSTSERVAITSKSFLKVMLNAALMFAAAISCIGCSISTKLATQPIFPQHDDVQILQVINNSNSQAVAAKTISDSEQVRTFIDALHSANGKWEYIGGTFPTPHAVVLLRAVQDQDLCYVDVGVTWIASNCGEPKTGYPPILFVSTAVSKFFIDFVDK